MSNGRNTGVRFGAPRMICIAALMLLAAGGGASAQGTYKPVTDADVVAMRMMHHFDADGNAKDPAFEWSFTKDGKFVVKQGTESIPAHLLKTLLKAPPADKAAEVEEITGKWKVKDGQLVLTDIKAGDAEGVKKAEFHIYRSAPTVIRVDHRQKDKDGKTTKVQYAFVVES